MAKKKTTTKSPKSAEGRSKQSIAVEVCKANPDMSAKDASAKIKAEYGIDVNPNYYQVTKSNYNLGKIDDEGKSTGKGQPTAKKKTAKKTARRTTTPSSNGALNLEVLNAAKDFSDQYTTFDEARAVLEEIDAMGGVAAALEAVNALEALQS